MITLTINNQAVSVPPGITIWEAARQLGVAIPVLCHSPRLQPVGVCRMCVVDVGGRTLAASCVRACENGMNVRIDSEKVERQRRMLTALLLAEHQSPCAREKTTGDCELEAVGRHYGLLSDSIKIPFSSTAEYPSRDRKEAVDKPLPYGRGSDERNSERALQRNLRPHDLSSPVIAVDHQACILCDRCIRACDDIQSNEVIGRTGKGHATRIAFDLDVPMGESTCVSCGECAASCPTGALVNKALTLPLVPKAETRAVDSVCPYCGVGCTLTYHVKDNQILYAEGRDGPGSQGRLCVKGRYGWDYTHHPQRLTVPLIRRPEFYPKGPLSSDVRGEADRTEREPTSPYAAFREASWDEALDLVAERLMTIKQAHGPGALAGFGSAKCSNEEAYLFQKLIRGVLGTNNVDHCTRLCHASSVAALLEGIGSGAVTDVFSDVQFADVVFLTGTNTTVNHPVAATFFKQAAKRGTKLIVVDPRRPQIADFATWYCRLKPGADVTFYNALLHVLIAEDLVNHDFIRDRTEQFEALKTVVRDYPPERMAALCDIEPETIRAIAHAIGKARNLMIFWGMGISQHTHGTDNARCLIALCLATGNVGRPGTGLHPLRGQNNVQGASDAGLIPMVYPDYQPVGNASIRQRFEQAWGRALDPKPGLTVVEIMQAVFDRRIQCMLMMGENPFLSDPNINKVRTALSRLEFLAVQDIFLTETCEFADVILPSASFLEKVGTYTNTDRRVQIGARVVEPPGQARPDWKTLCELAARMGYPMQYDSPETIFAEFAGLTTSYRGLSYATLGASGKVWPITETGAPETPVLFGDRFPTANGRGKFVPCEFLPAKELPDEKYPFVLNTGRLLEHWHTGTMTRRAAALDALEPQAFVEIHPADLLKLGIEEGEQIRVRSRRGAITLAVRAGTAVSPGSIFIPFHFREAAANLLTIDALDPYGKIPEFKYCAVRLERVSGTE